MLNNQQPDESEHANRFHSLVKSVLTANLVTFGMAVANDTLIGHTPVGFSQVAMEGVDAVLPVPLSLAEQAQQQGKLRRGLRWRNIANITHIGAAGIGIVEAANFINDPPAFDARNIAISGIIGLWNLGLLRKIRQHSRDQYVHKKVELTMQSVAKPESPEDVILEPHHYHQMKGRNLENLEAMAGSNIIEAAPAFVGPIAQTLWENGSAASVITANGIISAMMIKQLYLDHKLSRSIRQAEQVT